MSTRTTQEGNTAGGHIAGRDVIVNNAGVPTSLGRLIQQYQTESAQDQTLKEFIDELSLFAQPIPEEPIQGLEEKLKAAGRSDELYEALRLKEIIYERLKSNIGSQAFQQIYAYLMGLARERFRAYVRPMIDEGAGNAAIDTQIFARVVSPILGELEQCGETHDFTGQSVRGLIYFLAGNCYVRWN